MHLRELRPTLYATLFTLLATAQASAQCGAPYVGEILRPPGTPTRLASGDLNGDQREDLVIGTSLGLAVYLNQGSECLQFSALLPTPTPVRSLTLGHIDNDGVLDFASTIDGGVCWALGDGQGGFGPLSSLAAGNLPSGARLADATGDGKIDLCFVKDAPTSVVVLAGDGLGQFAPSVQLPIPSIPTDVAPADVDNDGDLDLVTDSYTSTNPQGGQLTVFLNLGAGSYSAGIVKTFTFTAGRIYVGHFDQNNRIDVLVSRSSDGSSTLFTGNGDGTFAQSVTTSGGCRVAVPVDVDLDGDLDVLLPEYPSSNPNTPRIKKHTNDGTGSFVSSGAGVAGGNTVTDAIAGDWNGDGFPDLALLDFYWRGVQLAWGDGSGGFRREQPLILSPMSPGILALPDLNNDARLDLIAAVGGTETAPYTGFQVSLGVGDGQFLAPTSYGAGTLLQSVAVGDFNHDGNVDVAALQATELRLYRGDGTGALLAPSSLVIPGGQCSVLVAVDLNEDGTLDLVASRGSIIVLLNNGAGNFKLSAPVLAFTPVEMFPGDFNGDGHPDLLCTRSDVTIDDMVLLRGDGHGGLTSSGAVGTGRSCLYASIGDLDGDKDLDAVAFAQSTAASSDLLIVLGNGTGGFSVSSTLPRPFGVGPVRAADIDMDGDLDVVGLYRDSQCIGVSFNDGAANFSQLRLFTSARAPKAVAVGDLDGDHRPDLVVGGISLDGASVHLHESSTSLTYCTAKINSLGCTPYMGSTGVSSATMSSGFVVQSTQVLNNKPGLLLHGISGRAGNPFQNGFLCIHAPVRRTTGVNSGGNVGPLDCSGVFAIDMNAFAAGALGGNPQPALAIAGTVVDTQWWGRDNGYPVPDNSSLSSALEYVVQP